MKSSVDTDKDTSVKDRVFSRITNESVEPRSKHVFMWQAGVVWLVWALSIMVGAVALAVLLFVSTHRYYDAYEATHDNFVTFFISVLPVVWIFVFGGMLALAVRQLRSTSRGYRVSILVLATSSLCFSAVLGVLFQIGGFGYSLDRWLGDNAPMYVSQIERDKKMWQNPAEGRLVGTLADMDTYTFIDTTGVTWTLNPAGLANSDLYYLESGALVRVLGAVSTSSEQLFYPCGVFPWMLNTPQAMKFAAEERKEFVDRMYGYHDSAKIRNDMLKIRTPNGTTTVPKDSPCYYIQAVERMYE